MLGLHPLLNRNDVDSQSEVQNTHSAMETEHVMKDLAGLNEDITDQRLFFNSNLFSSL